MKQPETDYALSAADVSRIIEMAWEDRNPLKPSKPSLVLASLT